MMTDRTSQKASSFVSFSNENQNVRKILCLPLVISIFALILFLPCAPAFAGLLADESSAVVLTYHRIGEDAYPETNLRTDQFLAHIEELSEGPYTILPLPEIIESIKNKKPLPPLTVAITLEGAYKSAIDEAASALLQKEIPFTIFYASDNLDANAGQYISWEELRRLKQNKEITVGILPASYSRFYTKGKGEIRRQINRARKRYHEEFGEEAKLFSYPFGELSKDYQDVVKEQKFDAAFALQSGSLYPEADFSALPRFAMTENYGSLDRLRLVAHALPLPATDIEPEDPLLKTARPLIGFTLDKALEKQASSLSCFVSSQLKTDLEIVGNRVEMRLPSLDPTGERVRVNCTMPAKMNEETETRHWRWLGMLLIYKGEETPPAPSAVALPVVSTEPAVKSEPPTAIQEETPPQSSPEAKIPELPKEEELHAPEVEKMPDLPEENEETESLENESESDDIPLEPTSPKSPKESDVQEEADMQADTVTEEDEDTPIMTPDEPLPPQE